MARGKRKSVTKEIKAPVSLGQREEFICSFCNKIFSKERTVLHHLCEQRRRYEQRNEKFSLLGFEAFKTINLKCNTKTQMTEEEFRHSVFYLACVKWGHFMMDQRCFEPSQYLKWLITLKVNIDSWTDLDVYNSWLYTYIFEENPWDGLERSMKTIIEWGENNHLSYSDYFKKAPSDFIISDIRHGMITGWLLLTSESGLSWLSSLGDKEIEVIWPWIDSSRWEFKFNKNFEIYKQISELSKENDI